MVNNDIEAHRGYSNFWSGFYMGLAVAAGGLFLLGTKKGRESLKRVLDATEDLEGSAEELIDEVGKRINKDNISMIEKTLAPGTYEDNLTTLVGRLKNVFHKR